MILGVATGKRSTNLASDCNSLSTVDSNANGMNGFSRIAMAVLKLSALRFSRSGSSQSSKGVPVTKTIGKFP